MPGGVEIDVFAAFERTKEDIKIASDESLDGHPRVKLPYKSESQVQWNNVGISLLSF